MLLLAGELPRKSPISCTQAPRVYYGSQSGRGKKTKPPKKLAKPPQPSATVRAGCNARFLLTRSTFPVRYPVRAPDRGPRWQTHAQRRNLGISVRPGQLARAATLPAIPAAGESATPSRDYRGDGTRTRIRRDGEALGVPTEIIRPGKTWERNQPNRA